MDIKAICKSLLTFVCICVVSIAEMQDFENGFQAFAPPDSKRQRFGTALSQSCARPRLGGSIKDESEHGLETESNFSASTTAANEKLPVMWPENAKVAMCFMCGVSSKSESPLFSDGGGFIPWCSYKKYQNGVAPDFQPFRKPHGERCNICSNTYACNGFRDEHGTMEKYKENVYSKHASSTRKIHTQFLEDRKEYIQDANVNSDTFCVELSKARVSKSAKDKFKKRKLEYVDNLSAKVRGPKKQFVEAESWDEKLDGSYDKEKEVEEMIMGEKRKGIWKMVGREGVWEAEVEQAQTIASRSIEVEGQGKLVDAAIAAKRTAIEGACLEVNKKREKKPSGNSARPRSNPCHGEF